MTTPYPPHTPKRLVRSKSNRVIGGVCAGVAQYLNMDPTLVRILTVVISLFTGVPVVLYIVALFVIPEEGSPDAGPPAYPPVQAPPQNYTTYNQPSAPASADPVWGSEGAPWEQPRHDAPRPADQAKRADEPPPGAPQP